MPSLSAHKRQAAVKVRGAASMEVACLRCVLSAIKFIKHYHGIARKLSLTSFLLFGAGFLVPGFHSALGTSCSWCVLLAGALLQTCIAINKQYDVRCELFMLLEITLCSDFRPTWTVCLQSDPMASISASAKGVFATQQQLGEG